MIQQTGKTPICIADNVQKADVDRSQTDLDPVTVIKEVNALLARISKFKTSESKVFRMLIRQVFNSKQICYKSRLSYDNFKHCLDLIYEKFIQSTGVYGEPVGPLASHSISEPATQLTLNTFHQAGTSALGQLGLPRLKELIDFRNTSVAIMTIYMKNKPEELMALNDK